MSLFIDRIAKAGALVVAALLTVSSVSAQPSALNHAVAPGYRPNYSAGTAPLRVYPGDKGYHSSMQIERYYQMRQRARAAAATAPAIPSRYVAAVEPAMPTVVVSIGEAARHPTMVAIRGPDGKVRSFAVAGNDVIKPRTIVLRPGDSLTIQFASARGHAPKKP